MALIGYYVTLGNGWEGVGAGGRYVNPTTGPLPLSSATSCDRPVWFDIKALFKHLKIHFR